MDMLRGYERTLGLGDWDTVQIAQLPPLRRGDEYDEPFCSIFDS